MAHLHTLRGETLRHPLWLALVALVAGAALGATVVFGDPLAVGVVLFELILVAAIFRRPERGVLAFVAVANLLPFAVIPVRVGFSFTQIDVILSALLAAWLLWTLYQDRPLVGTPLNLLVPVYLGLALTSFVLGLDYSIPPERFRLFLKSLNSTLLFFSVANCINTRAALRRILVWLMVSGWGAAVTALILQYLPEPMAMRFLTSLGFLGYPTGPDMLRPIADTRILRAIGTSIDPNVLGGLMMMVSALLLGQILSSRPLLGRKPLAMMLATTIAALLLTQSRSALGGLVVAAVLLSVLRDRRLLVVLVVATLALPLIPQASLLVSRLQTGLAFQDRAAAMRLDEYSNALNTIAAYPWFGIGFGEPPSIDLYLGVSSIYLLIGQEMGLIGLTAFLAILGMVGWEVVSGLRGQRDEEARGMLLSVGSALAAACSAGLLDHYYVNITFPHMVGLFWLYIGLATAAARTARGQGPQPQRHEEH